MLVPMQHHAAGEVPTALHTHQRPSCFAQVQFPGPVAVCIYSSPIFIPGPQPPFLHTWMAVTPGKMTSVAPRMSFRWSSLSSRLNHSASAACTYTGQLKIEAQVRCVE